MKNYFTTKRLCRAGIIAALYTAMTYAFAPFAFGPFQIRPAEALCILALIYPEAIPALTVGCALSNLASQFVFYDVLFGSLTTLVAAFISYLVGSKLKNIPLKLFLGGLFPVILNAVFLPLIWVWCYGVGEYIYILQALLVLVGQLLSVYGLGVPLFLAVKKRFIE